MYDGCPLLLLCCICQLVSSWSVKKALPQNLHGDIEGRGVLGAALPTAIAFEKAQITNQPVWGAFFDEEKSFEKISLNNSPNILRIATGSEQAAKVITMFNSAVKHRIKIG